MQTDPLISIVLGTYNGEPYLREQIDSILRQTYPRIELIVSDDGSTDATPRILSDYAARDGRVRVYFNETNLGLVKNFEQAVRHAGGDYIAFADQDDVWLPGKIERLLECIGNRMLVYSDSAYIDADGRLMGRKLSDYRNPVEGKNLFALDADSGIGVAGHALMFRRELLERALPFSTYIIHDAWMAYIAMQKGGIAFVPEVWVLYRQHGGNTVGGLGCRRTRQKRRPSKPGSRRARQALEAQRRTGVIDALLSRLTDAEPEFRDYLHKMRAYTLRPTVWNRIRRMLLRLRYLNRIYAPRKRNVLRKAFKVIKLF